jgi:esterase/lipase superfamily enzyme
VISSPPAVSLLSLSLVTERALVFVTLLLVIFGCAARPTTTSASAPRPTTAAAPAPAPAPPPVPAPAATAAPPPAPAAPPLRIGVPESFHAFKLAPPSAAKTSQTELKPPTTPASVAVFYGTDRKATGDRRPAFYYGGQRGGETPQLGICNVTIPPTHRLGEIETPFIASIPVLTRLSPRFEDPNKHVVVQGIAPLNRDDFLRHLRSRIVAASTHDAFVYVHGFNNSFADACRRAAQIAHDLKEFKGVPLMYSWASVGSPSPRAYLVDGGTIDWSLPHFERFLTMVASETGAETIHLIAHSMGSRLVAATLESLAKKAAVPSQLGQLVFAAADVDAATFKSRYLPTFKGVTKRTTSYVSSADEAMRLAHTAAKYPRAGEAGDNILVLPGMDTIDASPVDTSLIGHDYLATKAVFQDLFELLIHGKAPQERCGRPKCYFEALTRGEIKYWRFLKLE